MRQLESIAAARQIHYTGRDVRVQRAIDLAIGIGGPTLVMILHVVVQGHRYDIIQRIGCIPAVYFSLPAIFLMSIWPPILMGIAAVYGGTFHVSCALRRRSHLGGAVLALRLFLVRRYQFAKLLESSKSALTTSRFLRLIALAGLQIAFSLPIRLLVLVLNTQNNAIAPYESWAIVHEDFNSVLTMPITLWNEGTPGPAKVSSELGFWLPVVVSAMFFVFFGLGDESLAVYRSWGRSLRRVLCCNRASHSRSRCVRQALSRNNPLIWYLPPRNPSPQTTHTHVSLPSYPPTPSASDLEKGRGNATVQGVMVTIEKDDFSSL